MEILDDDDDAFISSMAGEKSVDIRNLIQDEIEKLKRNDTYSVAGTYLAVQSTEHSDRGDKKTRISLKMNFHFTPYEIVN